MHEQGSGGDHAGLRQRVVEHMRAHREHFEPFVEDDVGCGYSSKLLIPKSWSAAPAQLPWMGATVCRASGGRVT